MIDNCSRLGTSRLKKASGHRSEKQKGRCLGKGTTFPEVSGLKIVSPERRTPAQARGLSPEKHFISDWGDAMEDTLK